MSTGTSGRTAVPVESESQSFAVLLRSLITSNQIP